MPETAAGTEMTRLETDFVIVGSGIAGVRAAIGLAQYGEVVVITKSNADESNTEYAQGGVAVAMHDEDEIALHYKDTVDAGDGLCSEPAVRVLVEEGPPKIEELIEWGTAFDRKGAKLAFTREAAHSRHRVLRAGGDSTGQEINRTLIQKARSIPRIQLLPHCLALDLIIQKGECRGVSFLDGRTGLVREAFSKATLLSTGGLGRLFRETTNPDVATGDGFALALRAGAVLADMEFIQFHPTALKVDGVPHFLLSEAIRGEGGQLRNGLGEAFMLRYHPLGDLAPRDVVSRSIFVEAHRLGSQHVYLDLTHMGADHVEKRFPRIIRTCRRFGVDPCTDPVPVFPAAHYMMGGVHSDLRCRTTVPGLYAAGEVACTGVHGANRLASNSLLEGLVFGARAADSMSEEPSGVNPPPCQALEDQRWNWETERREPDAAHIRELMSESAGIVRDGKMLKAALRALQRMGCSSQMKQDRWEANSILLNARLMVAMALLREESRGGHYRDDFPRRNDEDWKKHIFVRLDSRRNAHFFKGQ
jgi:L-aspartate oxidase